MVASVVECRIARRIAALMSGTDRSSPSRYFSAMTSSMSASCSTSLARHSAACSVNSAGMSTTSKTSPLAVLSSLAQSRPFIWTRSMTPVKSPSVPHGSCSTSGTALRRSTIMSTVR